MNARTVIVGGGPAGLSAAIELAQHGVQSTLLEEASRLGGVVYRGPLRDGVELDYLGERYKTALQKLHGEFSAIAHLVDVRLNHRVVGGQGQQSLQVLDEHEQLQQVGFDQLLLCAGCHERSVPFPGWTTPGVIMLGGLQLQIKSGVVKPKGPTLIAGTGPLLMLVACQLHAAGVEVAGVYEACEFGRIAKQSLALLNQPQLFLDGLSMLVYLKRHGVAVHYGWGVVEAFGEGELSEVVVAPYSSTWQADLSQAQAVKANTLAVGYGFIPRTQLSQQMGLEHAYNVDGYLAAKADSWQQSSQASIHLAGDVTGIRGGEAAMLTGRIAALSILLQRGVLSEKQALEQRREYLSRLNTLMRFRGGIDRYTRRGTRQIDLPQADTVVCRCEHVTRADIDLALSQGVQDMAGLKMRTRVSMGDCQGRMCVGYCSDRLREAQGSAVIVDATTPHILPECFFDFALQSNALYPGLHKELLENHGMDFKFERTGLKYVIYDDEDRLYAEHIVANIPHLADEVRWLDQAALREAEPSVSHDAQGALEFLCDHQVSPFRLTDVYTEGARQNGVDLYFNTTVTEVMRQGSKVTGVRTDNQGAFHSTTLINAAGAWAAELSVMATDLSIPVAPVKGQIVLTERMPKLLNGCLTTSDCYLAQKDNGEILIGSTTEDKGFDVTTTFPEITGLVQGAMRCIPQLKDANLKRTWAGLRPGSPDELPILGPMQGVEGYLNACGHFRTGILTSAITGVMLDALVRHEPLPLDVTPFLADRFDLQPVGVKKAVGA